MGQHLVCYCLLLCYAAVDMKVMEDYSTSSFIFVFVRFACKVGYPKKLLPDAAEPTC